MMKVTTLLIILADLDEMIDKSFDELPRNNNSVEGWYRNF